MENQDIEVEELKALLDSGKAIHFFDVRNPDEYEEDNLGATLIPLGDLPHNLDAFDGLEDEDIYIHCRSGARSGRAKQYLEAQGFNKVHNVLGGIMAYREMEA
ncbi:rhodanese-like domain-containing protein [Marinilongibacter aquaticus]|uniref:rhodanese-like domain-containing protein n=1 Tax=Marinilongibacter aquaticus TaxID=2975157 RepID=UPI0021BD444F|nr:rhodanese-like domain-containing protein [Marinilongibacter aquaticus]UBM58884.1 rhodanese-like domain-containing protein [Marinilongibacter aquaticus]